MSVSDNQLPASSRDLNASARIRNAALELFAARGVEATSIRAVAQAAGVSPGLVQHYFPAKADLCQAVDEYVMQVTATAFAEMPREGATTATRVEAVGRRVAWLFRHRALGNRYVARGLVDRDERALTMFDALYQLVRQLMEEDVRDGRARTEIDVDWAALHALVFHFGVVLLEHAIERHLPEPLRTEEQLERWRRATEDLYRHGMYRP